VEHINFMLIGGLIIFFLIVEPHGLARLWQIAKEKLRTWPFPYYMSGNTKCRDAICGPIPRDGLFEPEASGAPGAGIQGGNQ
jgi:hypothetical protein